jgi:hypothetical protein
LKPRTERSGIREKPKSSNEHRYTWTKGMPERRLLPGRLVEWIDLVTSSRGTGHKENLKQRSLSAYFNDSEAHGIFDNRQQGFEGFLF